MLKKKKGVAFRTGKLVYLRPIEIGDVPDFYRWMNDPEVTQYLMRVFPLTELEEREWVEKQKTNPKNVVLGIVDAKRHTLIGVIGLHKIDYIHGYAETGTSIGEKEYWSKGYGTEAKMLLLEYAFNTLGLRNVLSRVIAFNGRSLRYAEKCGYKQVGILPGWIYRHGTYYDEILLAVTKTRWQKLWKKYKKKHLCAK